MYGLSGILVSLIQIISMNFVAINDQLIQVDEVQINYRLNGIDTLTFTTPSSLKILSKVVVDHLFKGVIISYEYNQETKSYTYEAFSPLFYAKRVVFTQDELFKTDNFMEYLSWYNSGVNLMRTGNKDTYLNPIDQGLINIYTDLCYLLQLRKG